VRISFFQSGSLFPWPLSSGSFLKPCWQSFSCQKSRYSGGKTMTQISLLSELNLHFDLQDLHSPSLPDHVLHSGWTIKSVSITDTNGDSTNRTTIGGGVTQDSAVPLDVVTHSGNSENNVISGDAANNTIAGQEGDDILSGGAGSDTFIYNIGDGNDTIKDFDGRFDRLVLIGISKVSVNDDGNSATVSMEDGSYITLPSASSPISVDDPFN
jgi:Ca2+-binding RTX toxin-like protein